jgi:hypothetical protein
MICRGIDAPNDPNKCKTIYWWFSRMSTEKGRMYSGKAKKEKERESG